MSGTHEYVRFTLVSAARTSIALGSVILTAGGHTASYSGGLVLLPAVPFVTTSAVTGPFTFSKGSVAPGEIISVFGDALGPATGFLTASGSVQTKLGDVQVMFDGVAAPLFFTSNGQLNVEVPYEVAGHGTTVLTVVNGAMTNDALTLQVAAAAPDILPFAVNADGARNSAATPAAPGFVLLLFATGLGVLDPLVKTGELAAGIAYAAGVAVLVDAVPYPEMLLYAGAAPGFTGLNQIDLLRTGLAAGKHSVQIVASGVNANAVDVWVQ